VRLEDRVEAALASKDWEEGYAAYEDIQVLSSVRLEDSEQICVGCLGPEKVLRGIQGLMLRSFS
jgi:hypothetical protein